jgi:uncharacterized protein
MQGSRCLRRVAVCAIVVLSAVSRPAGVSSSIVISQVYGGGGNTGAPYNADFIELFNRGSVPAALTGWSIQYASATGTGNFGANSGQLTELPDVTLQPGQYFLVQQAAGAAGVALPAADFVDATPIAMAAGAGKVALVTGTAGLGCNGGSAACNAAALARIVDLVGYGNANFAEGATAPALSNTSAAIRGNSGCSDTDSNAADFTAAAPAPRNTGSPRKPCAGAPSLTIDDVAIGEGDSGFTVATFTVSLSAVTTSPVSFSIATSDDTATAAGGDYASRTLTGQIIPAGATTYQFEVTINGDIAVEPDESFGVTLTSAVNASVADGRGTATIINDDIQKTPIHDIQGAGAETPLAGVLVATTGIVTARKSSGFFLQAPDADIDADSQTSEGIFVFTSTAPAVLTGDAVMVRGIVSEYFSLTEISTTLPAGVAILSRGNPLPSAVTLTPAILNPAGTPAQLERFEGMRVHAGTLVSVAPTNEFGEIFTVLQGVARPMREPGIEISLAVPPDPLTGVVDCCIPRWDENPERLMIDSDGRAGSAPLSVTSNVTLSNVTGPLDFSFDDYKIVPETTPVAGPSMTAIAVPGPAANEFTVAGFNIENFTGTATQRAKAALAIRNVLRLPDIIGHVEIASQPALQSLADQVNTDTLAATGTNPGYQAFLIPFGSGTQHVGFLVKTSRVQVNSVTQERAGEQYVNPETGALADLHDRPPLVLRATIDPAGTNAGDVIVVVNHLRSFIDVELTTATGARVRAKRTAQAESLASLLQELQTNNPDVPVISIGDYNAFEFTDGFTDPIGVIKGVPTPTSQVVAQQSPDLVTPDFVNLTDSLPAHERYSFIFEGTPQALDHVLLNTTAARYRQRYAVARNNADFPDTATLVGDASRSERASDHDMPVAYFAFPGTPVVTLNGSAFMTVEAFAPFVDPGATAHDDFVTLAVTVDGTVNVNVPGEYEVRYTASNGYKTTIVTRTVRVADTTPPVIQGLGVSPDSVTVPNHKMIDVAVAYSAADLAGTPACTLAVAGDEPVDGVGDGHTATDWQILDAHAVLVRSERAGQGDGRVYTITVSCTDASGNTASASATVAIAKGK